MKTNRSILTYFSATYTTRKVSQTIIQGLTKSYEEYDLTCQIPAEDIYCESNDLLVVGVPVYAGRVPQQAAKALKKFKGQNTPSIIVCVYGNRDYDDALLELQNIVEENGFKTIAAATFIAQHSIFPQIATGRPDAEDYILIKQFSKDCADLISNYSENIQLPKLQLKGNFPYKEYKKIPFQPSTLRLICSKCGRCAKLCPTKAINFEKHCETNDNLCISCGRCIIECPRKARQYFNVLHKASLVKFTNNYVERRAPEFYSFNLNAYK